MKKMIELIRELLRALKPFLMYFQKCTFPKDQPNHCFHIIGVDVLFDSDGNPWFLEFNANPSINIEFNPTGEKTSKLNKTEYPISVVDLHVKKG